MKNRSAHFRILWIVLFAFVLSLQLGAQDDNEQISTLFGDKDGHIDHGGWAGLNFGYTKINNNDTYIVGARGGWLINHRFTLGLAGNGLLSDRDYLTVPLREEEVNLAGGYGGLFLEATIFPFSPVHISIPVIIGAGGVAYTTTYWRDDYWNDPYNNYTLDADAFFVLEPGIELELNLIKFMRFAIGGSYRYTSEISLIESDSDMLRGFNGHFALKFGWF